MITRLFTCAILATLTAGAIADDWSQWRGPNRSGVSNETGLLDKWPEDGPPLLWKAKNAGVGYATVAIKDGRVITMGDRKKSQYVIAYNEADGKELWKRRVDKSYQNRYGDGPRCTPTIDGERVYALSATGRLYCLNAETGKKIWTVNLVAKFGGGAFAQVQRRGGRGSGNQSGAGNRGGRGNRPGGRNRTGGGNRSRGGSGAAPKNLIWGISESPLIEENMVICNAGAEDGSILALDKMTGKVIWRSEGMDDAPCYASAIAATVGDIRQIITFTHKGTVGLRAADGKLLWRYDKVSNGIANCTTPVIADGHVFLTSGYDKGCALLKLTADGESMNAEEVYFNRSMINHHGGVILVDGYIYGASNQTWMCLDFKTGQRKWRARGVGKGSLTAADGKLILVGEKGTVGLAEATPDGYREISKFEIEPLQKNLWAYPVVHNKRLYIRNGNELLCYDLSADADVEG